MLYMLMLAVPILKQAEKWLNVLNPDVMKKKYVSNSQESVRMFKSGLLEALSKVHYLVPVFIFMPVILFCIYKSFFDVQIPVLTFFGYFALGLFIWTLTEYVMHRFVFHYAPPDKPWAQRRRGGGRGGRRGGPGGAGGGGRPPAV